MGREVNSLCAAAALVLSSSVAFADEAAPASSDGLLKFTNVHVINAPATIATSGSTQSGMRAFKDGATGQMRGPSMEEMQTMSTEKSVSSSDKPQFYGPKSGITVFLDESSMQYSVMVRQPDGSLAEVCVTGIDQANEVMNNHASLQVAPLKGVRNDR